MDSCDTQLFSYSVRVQKQQISYDGDPLADFTQMRFLDRFVYRNPKKTKPKRKDLDETIHYIELFLADHAAMQCDRLVT